MATLLLTSKQKKALLLYAFKFSYQEIGEQMNTSKDTAKNEIHSAYRALHVNCLVMALIVCLVLDEITVEDLRCFYYSLPKR